jgi:hypothetical protein
MRWFEVTPRSLIANFGETIARAFDRMAQFAGWAVDYVLVGAVVVVPVWAIWFVFNRLKGK